MNAIILKEINAFFSSIIGYLVIGIFLVFCSLFLWFFQGGYNIFDAGFASLDSFFQIAPWILLLLIPAVTMRSFAEEKKQGTYELLLTKPLSLSQLVLGKYVGSLLLCLIALLPTLLYVITIHYNGNPVGNFDAGAMLGSYLGLIFLVALYTAIGIFASSLTNNQIVAFIIALLFCFLLFYLFEGIADTNLLGSETYGLEYLGINYHYKSISRGVVDSRDVIYFVSATLFFLGITNFTLATKKV